MIIPAIFASLNQRNNSLKPANSSQHSPAKAGGIVTTDRNTDLAIDGNGYFVIDGHFRKYTRNGEFFLDPDDFLVNQAGENLLGYGVDANFRLQTNSLKKLRIPFGKTTMQQTSTMKFAGNLDADGVVATGASILTTQLLTTVGGEQTPTDRTPLINVADAGDPADPLFAVGEVYTLDGVRDGTDLAEATFVVREKSTLGDLSEFLTQALGINMDVPDDANPDTPTAGVTIEPDDVNTATARLVVTGNLGEANALELPDGNFSEGTKSPFQFADGINSDGIASNPNGESVHTNGLAYDSRGTPVDVGVTAVLESSSQTGNQWRIYAESEADTDTDLVIGTGILDFDTNGKVLGNGNITVRINRNNTGAKQKLKIALNFSSVTELVDKSSVLVMSDQNGSPVGTLHDFAIGADGSITGFFSNGLARTIGQIVLAGDDDGSNIGPANSGGRGKIVDGALNSADVPASEIQIHHRRPT